MHDEEVKSSNILWSMFDDALGEHPDILPYTLEYFSKAVTSLDSIGGYCSFKEWTAEILDWTMKKI